MELSEKERNRRINKKLTITFFSILIPLQLITLAYTLIVGLNPFTLVLIIISATVFPVIIGYTLIYIFSKAYYPEETSRSEEN
ncbi:MAG: hypothetical protein ACP6IP_00100 [Candidatus Njordarchaeia archaeon]